MSYMTPDEFKQFIAIMADVVGTDALQAERFAFAIKKACPQIVDVWKNLGAELRALTPFPPHDQITAAQCTLFDNWKQNGGRKPKTVNGKREKGARVERFKVMIEAWTIDPRQGPAASSSSKLTVTNATFVGTAHLMDGPTLKKKVAELRLPKKTKGRPFAQRDPLDEEGPSWQAFGDFLHQTSEDMRGLRLGPVFTVGDGTRWHLDSYVVAEEPALMSLNDLAIVLRSPSGEFAFNEWSETYPNGSALRGNAVLSSRISILPDKKFWVTTQQKP